MYNSIKSISLYFIISFTYTLTSSFYFAHLLRCQNADRVVGNYLAVSSGDTFSYLGAVDNYKATGTYYFINLRGEKTFAGRLPHYGSIYYVLSLLLSQKAAYDTLVILQIAIHSISVVLLAALAFHITKSKVIYWIVFVCYLFTSYTSIWVLYLSPESISTSLLIIFLFFYQKYTSTLGEKSLLLSSVFLSLLVVLKPYFIILYLFIGLHFISRYRYNVKMILRKTLLVSITLIALLSPWIVRNYLVLKKFIPLQENITAGYGYSDSELSMRKYINAWGGSFISWDPNEAGCYFIRNESIQCQFSLPKHAISQSFSKEDVEEVRQLFFALQRQYSDSLDKIISLKFDNLTQKYAKDMPQNYYFFSPLSRLKKFIVQSNTYNLPIHPSFACYNTLQKAYKIIQYILYYILFGLGVLGMMAFHLSKKKKWNVNLMYISIFLYITLLFPIVLGASEWRYMLQVFPILVLWAGLSISILLSYYQFYKPSNK